MAAPPSSWLQTVMQSAVQMQSVKWTYGLFWQNLPQQEILVWRDGYYNGPIKSGETVQPTEVNVEASLQRSQQLRELYESLSAGETNQPEGDPSTALSPEDLTETEWFYLMCPFLSFPPGTSLPGKAYANGHHVWLTGADEVDSQTFTRTLFAKSARIQTVVCIPLPDGVVELGTTERVQEDTSLVDNVRTLFIDYQPPLSPKPAQTSNAATSSGHRFFQFQPIPTIHAPANPPASADQMDKKEEDNERESDSEAKTGRQVAAAVQNPSVGFTNNAKPSEPTIFSDVELGLLDDRSNNLDSNFPILNQDSTSVMHQRRLDSFRTEITRRWQMMQDPTRSVDPQTRPSGRVETIRQKLKIESRTFEAIGCKRARGEDELARLNQDKMKLLAESNVAENAGDVKKKGEDGSKTVRYAGKKEGKDKVKKERPNQDTTELGVESSVAEYAGTKDVFLSFGGLDSFGFVNSLYHRLKADGISVIRDHGNHRAPRELPVSVYDSKIYMPIFSECYADSCWCLETLALMVEDMRRWGGKKEILPVFYHVERLDEKLETKVLYRDALDRQRRNWDAQKVEQWKKALAEAGKFKRWKLRRYEREDELITSIVGEVLFKLMKGRNYVLGDRSTGDDPKLSDRTLELKDIQELKIMELLKLELNDVRIVGIHGIDGIGKTALAKIIYDKISLRFDACSFLMDIEETGQQPGGVEYLQTKFIFDIMKREYEIVSAFKGVRFLKEIFRDMKVLIVLDDVEKKSLLKEFVGAKLDWFGPGSRIIVTSKTSKVLQGFVDQKLAHTYYVNPMEDNAAFNLFWQYAPRESNELRSFVKIAIEIVKAATGLPLLLKVFGSFLHHKALKEWIMFKCHIQQFQDDYQKILSIIYDALDQKQKQMYLDIACFTPDVDCRIASYMWHHYDCPHHEIEVLHRMSLIKMEEDKIGMHSMLRCLARKIIREGFHDPRTGVGLHIPAKAKETKKGIQRTNHLNAEVGGFEVLLNTTFLSLGCAVIDGQLANALLNVQWLHWTGCPGGGISILLEKNESLVILDLSWSKVTESWRGWEKIKMERLKVLNLTGCVDLLATPSFSYCPNLEILILERCSRLVHLDPSLGDLKLLVTLNLKFCSELSVLPSEIDEMNALQELLIDGTSVRELPVSEGNLFRLRTLSATNCSSLVHVPSLVCALISLSVLALDETKVLELPESIGDLWQLRRLSLRDCRGLGKLPDSIGKLRYSLEELDISGTGISRLPDSTKNLQKLEVLKMGFCFLREFPSDVGELRNLEKVDASGCRNLKGVIPSDISKLRGLRELRLRGTRISGLPSEIQYMSSLETLDLLNCDLLAELPPLPTNLSNLYVNPDLKENMLKSSEFHRWWHLLQ